MANPKPNNDPTAFLSFMKEDATTVWIRRDAILYYYQDTVNYKTVLTLINGHKFVVSETCQDIQDKCKVGS